MIAAKSVSFAARDIAILFFEWLRLKALCKAGCDDKAFMMMLNAYLRFILYTIRRV